MFDRIRSPLLISRYGRPLAANKAFAVLFGYPGGSDVVALGDVSALIAPADRALWSSLERACLEEERHPLVQRYIARRADGTAMPVVCSVQPTLWEGRMAVRSMHLDLSRSEDVEQALGGMRDSFLDLAEESMQGLLVHRDLRVLYANPALARMFGYPGTREVLALPSVLDLFALGEHERLRRDAEHQMAGDEVAEVVEIEGRHRDGSAVWLLVSSRVIEWAGAPAIQKLVFDITERRRMEQALRTAMFRAEKATLQKTRFLANASHDLRQPLQAVTLLVDALREDELPAPSRALVERLDKAVSSLEGLLRALLDYSKLEAGVVEPNFAPVSLASLFLRLFGDLEPQAAAKGLFLRYVDTTLSVRSDPLLLELILRNLLGNALRYTRKGGVLWGCRRRGRQAEIQVWDSGIGIPPEHQDLVFDEYHRVPGGGTDEREGLGLGLSVVREAARTLGHAVSLRSVPGRGSMFSITLPLSGVPAPLVVAPVVRAAPSRENSGATILVVDDEPSVCELIALTLGRMGYRTQLAKSGDEALRVVAEGGHEPDLIIADYSLASGKTGPEAAKALARKVGHDIPVIVITGETDPVRLRRVQGLGMQILQKPVQARELGELVALTLSRNRSA